MSDPLSRVLDEADRLIDEATAFTSELIRIPTLNPPGDCYADAARAIGARLARHGFDVEYLEAEGCVEHTARHPRINVVGTRRGRADRPLVHLNGHMDVVPAGDGWTVDPFGGLVKDGNIYGRGSADMKAGIAAAVYAVEAIRRAGVELHGTVEISGTVDEESGGWAGVAWLARHRRIASERTDYVVIPEPLDVDRICVGHRGVYWFEVETFGRIAHGSMPFLGRSAIDLMGHVLQAFREELAPRLAGRLTSVPVVPPAARRPTLNVNAITGGQAQQLPQTPCVADRCAAVFDRRFLLEEGFDEARREIVGLLDRLARTVPDFRYDIRDLMVVPPVRTPDDSPLVAALRTGIQDVLGRAAAIVASPGTYDHKHVARLAGVAHCVAYGPGILELAHQPDEYCRVDHLRDAIKVLASTVVRLAGVAD